MEEEINQILVVDELPSDPEAGTLYLIYSDGAYTIYVAARNGKSGYVTGG